MQTKQTSSMRDFAKDKIKSPFVEDFERAQQIAFRTLQKAITPKGWANRIFHALAGKPFFGNWN